MPSAMLLVKFASVTDPMIVSIMDNSSVMQKCADLIRAKAIRYVPVDQGELRRSIRAEWKWGQFRIWADTPYADYIEYGTPQMEAAHGEHDPLNPVLVWDAKRNRVTGLRKKEGSNFFSNLLREVKGKKPKLSKSQAVSAYQRMPFLRPALFNSEGEIRAALANAVKSRLDGMTLTHS
jgi:hypothetical protein